MAISFQAPVPSRDSTKSVELVIIYLRRDVWGHHNT